MNTLAVQDDIKIRLKGGIIVQKDRFLLMEVSLVLMEEVVLAKLFGKAECLFRERELLLNKVVIFLNIQKV